LNAGKPERSTMSAMKEFLSNSYLFGANAPFIEELYEAYLDNPQSVPEQWREYFDKLQAVPAAGNDRRDVAHAPIVEAFAQRARAGAARPAPAVAGFDRKQVSVLGLIAEYRFRGVLIADIDPLKRRERLSLEGGDTLIPMLDNLLQRAGEAGVQELVLGMAHRGRLNVLVNTLGKMPKDLFSEFEGKHDDALLAGDVKYHQGFSSDINTPGGPMHLTLAFNPSHLEIVNPVVEGSVRARQHRRKDRKGEQVLPVLIHGDAAVAGQGVGVVSLNLYKLRGS